MAYRIKLPASSRIYNIIPVLSLELFIQRPGEEPPPPDNIDAEGEAHWGV